MGEGLARMELFLFIANLFNGFKVLELTLLHRKTLTRPNLAARV